MGFVRIFDVINNAFQSTPVIADERMLAVRLIGYGPLSFNPRPSLLTSEWYPIKRTAKVYKKFQSTPVIADERMPR